jgi:hypothetical protein
VCTYRLIGGKGNHHSDASEIEEKGRPGWMRHLHQLGGSNKLTDIPEHDSGRQRQEIHAEGKEEHSNGNNTVNLFVRHEFLYWTEIVADTRDPNTARDRW